MIPADNLSIYTLQHKQNKICENNLRLIQEAMRLDDLAGSKFKRISTDFPNLEILSKSVTPGEIQATYLHTSVGNKSLGKTVTALALSGSLKMPTVVLIDIKRALAGDGEKIGLTATEVFLRSRRRRSSKIEEALGLDGQERRPPPAIPDRYCTHRRRKTAEALLKIFAKRITE